MRIPNRKLKRNRALYAALMGLWTVLLFILLFLIPSDPIMTLIETGIILLLVGITARSFLRMPISIVVSDEDIIVMLPYRRVTIPIKDLIDMRYDPSDCKLRVIAATSSHSFGDLGLDRKDEEVLRDLINGRDHRTRGKGGRPNHPRKI